MYLPSPQGQFVSPLTRVWSALLCFGMLFGTLTMQAEANISSEEQWARERVLFTQIRDKYKVQDEEQAKKIMAYLRKYTGKLSKEGLEDANLSLFGISYQKPEAKGEKVIEVKDEKKKKDPTPVRFRLPVFPRISGGKILADIGLSIGGPFPSFAAYELEMAQSADGNWTIAQATRTYKNTHTRTTYEGLELARYTIKEPITMKEDTFTAVLKSGNLFIGRGKPDQFNTSTSPWFVYFEGDGTVSYAPTDRIEKQQLEFYYGDKPKEYEPGMDKLVEKCNELYFRSHPDNLVPLIASWKLEASPDTKDEARALAYLSDSTGMREELKSKNLNKSGLPSWRADDTSTRFYIFNVANKKFNYLFYIYSDNYLFEKTGYFTEEIMFGEYNDKIKDLGIDGVIRVWGAQQREDQRAWQKIADPKARKEARYKAVWEDKEKLHIEQSINRIDIDDAYDLNVQFTMVVQAYEEIDNAQFDFGWIAPGRIDILGVLDNEGRTIFYSQAENTFIIPLYPPLKKDEKRTFHVRYNGVGVVYKGLGNVNWVSNGWLPDYGYLSKKKVETLFSVPKPLVLSSVGNLVSQWSERKKNFFLWQEPQPIILPGFMFGDYKTSTMFTKDVDYTDSQGTTIAKGDRNLSLTAYLSTANLTYFAEIGHDVLADVENSGDYSAGDLEQARRQWSGTVQKFDFSYEVEKNLKHGERALAFFAGLFGPYPYQKFNMVQMPYFIGYGQGLPSMIILTGETFMTHQQKAAFGQGTENFFASFMSHEVSHQWWGHVVPWKSPGDQWLSEAFAQISSNLFVQDSMARGNVEYEYTLKDWRDLAFAVDHQCPAGLGHPRLQDQAVYFIMLYMKGAYEMHNLRMMLPMAPRKDASGKVMTDKAGKPLLEEYAFLKLFRTFCDLSRQKELRYRKVTGLDFQLIIEKMLGEKNMMELYGQPNMDWWFDQKIDGWGRPKYLVKYKLVPGKKGEKSKVVAEITQEQGEENLFYNPIKFYFTNRKGERIIKNEFVQAVKKQTFEWEFDTPVVDFKMDEFRHLYAEIRYDTL